PLRRRCDRLERRATLPVAIRDLRVSGDEDGMAPHWDVRERREAARTLILTLSAAKGKDLLQPAALEFLNACPLRRFRSRYGTPRVCCATAIGCTSRPRRFNSCRFSPRSGRRRWRKRTFMIVFGRRRS